MRLFSRALFYSAACAAVLLAAAAGAERTRLWRQSSFDDFEKGTAKGVALRSDGRLVLAPRFAQFADPNTAYLWALRVDSKGRLYGAGGSNARVLRFDDKGASAIVFDSQELAAHALAFDAQDNLYVATSPDGKVHKVGADGKSSVFFDPKTKYIWDLAMDPAGTLYVATGDKGDVYAVSRDGKGELYFSSEETHARSLAFDSNGNLLVGTDPNGLILRVEKGASGGPRRAFVVYETAKKEVTALIADKAGNLFAAAIGEKSRLVPAVGQPAPVQQPPPPQVQPGAPPQPQLTTFVPFPPQTGGSAVYRIATDGAPEELWTSREDLVYSLAFAPSGKLLLGTGNKGTILQLEGNSVFSSLAKTASAQVTGLAQGPGGKVFVGTSNPGKVFALGPDAEPEGSFESQTFDAKIFSQWGRLSWWGENGTTNGKVAFYVRTGNTSNPEKNWSSWSTPLSDAKGSLASSPAARFAQWKAVLKAGGESPTISWVNLAYLPKNVAPSVDGVVVQNPGVRVQGFSGSQPPQQQQPVQLRLPSVASGQTAQPQPPRFEPPPQGFVSRGMRGVLWSASDDNDDDLAYTVYYRGEGEPGWRVLKDNVEQKFYSWDTTTMPDGAYYLKVVVSDAAANPPGEGLTGERESDRFEVDNTPPAISGMTQQSANPEVRVRFDAQDSYSNLARAEFSLNAGEWKTIFPTDRTMDAPKESFEIVMKDLPPGEHTLTVRVYDQFENSATDKITIRTEAPPRRR